VDLEKWYVIGTHIPIDWDTYIANICRVLLLQMKLCKGFEKIGYMFSKFDGIIIHL